MAKSHSFAVVENIQKLKTVQVNDKYIKTNPFSNNFLRLFTYYYLMLCSFSIPLVQRERQIMEQGEQQQTAWIIVLYIYKYLFVITFNAF
jgi:hypothetical protein